MLIEDDEKSPEQTPELMQYTDLADETLKLKELAALKEPFSAQDKNTKSYK